MCKRGRQDHYTELDKEVAVYGIWLNKEPELADLDVNCRCRGAAFTLYTS